MLKRTLLGAVAALALAAPASASELPEPLDLQAYWVGESAAAGHLPLEGAVAMQYAWRYACDLVQDGFDDEKLASLEAAAKGVPALVAVRHAKAEKAVEGGTYGLSMRYTLSRESYDRDRQAFDLAVLHHITLEVDAPENANSIGVASMGLGGRKDLGCIGNTYDYGLTGSHQNLSTPQSRLIGEDIKITFAHDETTRWLPMPLAEAESRFGEKAALKVEYAIVGAYGARPANVARAEPTPEEEASGYTIQQGYAWNEAAPRLLAVATDVRVMKDAWDEEIARIDVAKGRTPDEVLDGIVEAKRKAAEPKFDF